MTLIKDFFTKSTGRSIAVLRNMFFSIILKGVHIGLNLLLVPLTLGYLAEEEYGIWLTLSSMLIWFSFFDIGLTNGLRNKLTEAIACNDKKSAKIYVSTTFVLLMGIVASVLILFMAVYQFINWSAVFNTMTLNSQTLGKVALIAISFFLMQFVLEVVLSVYFATQRAAIVSLINTAGTFLSLAIIFILTKVTPSGSLLYVAAVFSIIPFLVYFAAYLLTFYGKYKYLRPSFKCVDFRYAKGLVGLGINFFIIQISWLILFQTSNFIITQLSGPEYVTIYGIAYKYFNVVTMGFGIILTPLWNAYTDAYVKGDFTWIKNVMQKIVFVWGLSVCGTALMTVISPFVYQLWIGEKVASTIPFSVSLACAVFVSMLNWNTINSYVLNGVGKIKLQLYLYIIAVIIFIPLAIFMGKQTGITGVVYAMCIVLLPGTILHPIQCIKIVNQKATGIWNK